MFHARGTTMVQPQQTPLRTVARMVHARGTTSLQQPRPPLRTVARMVHARGTTIVKPQQTSLEDGGPHVPCSGNNLCNATADVPCGRWHACSMFGEQPL